MHLTTTDRQAAAHELRRRANVLETFAMTNTTHPEHGAPAATMERARYLRDLADRIEFERGPF